MQKALLPLSRDRLPLSRDQLPLSRDLLPLSRDRLPLSKDSQSDEPPLQTGTIRAWLLRQLRESVTMVVDLPKLLKTSMERHSFKKVDPGQRVE